MPPNPVLHRVLLSWSSGKDSAWTLHALRQQGAPVVGLLTTLNEAVDRVAMHGVRRSLVELQAGRAGLPLWTVPLPWPCTNEEYERRMGSAMKRAREEGITHIAFGDLFLEDIREYRIRQLAGSGIEPLFPVWTGPDGTAALARQMLDAGLAAILTCVDPARLDPSFAGRRFDAQVLDEFPPSVDPLGERGEFHTVCVAGPMFEREIPVTVGLPEEHGDFWYADVMPN